jgi:small GTP-binding protein
MNSEKVPSGDQMKPLPASFKVVVVGASAVGKSSMVQRLVQGTFTEDGTTTCGADFYTYACPVDNNSIRLQIWDTAGQERFRSISKSYFRNAVGAILVYDITSMASFDQLTDWLNDLQSLCLPNAYILLVGNKSDLESQREVGAHRIKEFSERHKLEPIETSALNGRGVKEAFTRLAFEVYNRVKSSQITPSTPVKAFPQQGGLTQADGDASGCC